jgi:hypothetical protein
MGITGTNGQIGQWLVKMLAAAVKQFLAWEGCFRPEVLRENAERFGQERFLTLGLKGWTCLPLAQAGLWVPVQGSAGGAGVFGGSPG